MSARPRRGILAGALVVAGTALTAPVALAAPPANDGFANAEVLSGDPATTTGTNVEATSQTNEPEHVTGIAPGKSVWYSWTASANSEVVVDTCTSDFDTVLAAYSGSALDSLTRLDSNDDTCGLQSEVAFDATSGETYWIAVDGFSSDSVSYDEGNVGLQLTATPEPPPAPPGPPETFYVRSGATGTDCTSPDPADACATIAEALTAHRATSGPGDVIDVGPGTFDENVEAGEADDDELTIQGSLTPGGFHRTAITGSGGGASCPAACVVRIGDVGVDVLLRDVDVTTDDTSGAVGPIMIGGGSDLKNVYATDTFDSFGVTGIVEQLDEEQGKVIEDSVIEAGDNAVGIWGDGGMTVRDSDVYSGYQPIQSLGCGCSAANAWTIVRSWIEGDPNSGQPVMNLAADLTLDSSLVTGGGPGAVYQGDGDSTWQIDNSTIDVRDPGVADTDDSLVLSNQGTADVVVNVNNSILVEPIDIFDVGAGAGTITCNYTDMRTNTIAAEWTEDCHEGSNSNTTTDPATLFVGDNPPFSFAFDWKPAAGSTAVDSGDPAALAPGLSSTDIQGVSRVRAGTAGTCTTGIRDRGAYERSSVCGGPQTYYVTTTGSGSACTNANPCASIEDALQAHYEQPHPGDVIDVGPGDFSGNFAADLLEDDGLTIRGTLAGNARQTNLHAEADGADDSGFGFLAGSCGEAQVQVRDMNLDTEGAELTTSAMSADGGSDLLNVHLSNQQDSVAGGVLMVCQRGTNIDRSTIDTTGTDGDSGILGLDGFRLRDSHIELDSNSGPGIIHSAFPGANQKLELRRSWIDNGTTSFAPGIFSQGDVILDSSLVTGGTIGVESDNSGSIPRNLRVRSSTIDVGGPGFAESGLPDILFTSDAGDDGIDLNVDSSILVEEISFTGSEGSGAITCSNTDLLGTFLPSPPDFTDDCVIGSNGNTTTDPADQFVGGSPFDWSLVATAPAVDAGTPGPIPNGFSTHDLAGNPRRAAGTTATCPAGIIDMGAYEFAGPPCNIQLPALTGSSPPEVDTQIGSNRGRWTNSPTSFQSQWLRCDTSGDNCVSITPLRSDGGTYTPKMADVGATLRVRYIATNPAGDSDSALSDPSPVVVLPVPVNTQAPAIKNGGAPAVGTSLGSNQGKWKYQPTSYKNQFLRCDAAGDNCNPIMNYRTGTGTYRVRPPDVGSTIRVRFIATNGTGDSLPATSAATPVVGP